MTISPSSMDAKKLIPVNVRRVFSNETEDIFRLVINKFYLLNIPVATRAK